MDFVLNKLLLVFVLSNVYLGTEFNLPRNDLIILNNGEEIKCHIDVIDDGLIKAETNSNEITIVREMNINSARDIVEAGIVKNVRYSGRIKYYGPFYLEIETHSGVVQIKKGLIKKIVISQEPSFNL